MKHYNKTFCIFLDLLGFSKITLDQFSNNQTNVFEKLITVIDDFEKSHIEVDENRLNYFSVYSDSIIWIFSYNETSNNTSYPCEFDACMSKIDGDLFYLLINLLENGFLFRGGISSGKTIVSRTSSNINGNAVYSENILFSESLVKAAGMEKKIKYPVLGLSDINLFSSLHHNGYGLRYVEQFQHTCKLSIVDPNISSNNDFAFLDHLGLLINSFNDPDSPDFLFNFFTNHKTLIEQNLTNSDSEIFRKYDFLKKYHNIKIQSLSRYFSSLLII